MPSIARRPRRASAQIDDAFARRQAVGLDDDRKAELRAKARAGAASVNSPYAAVGTPASTSRLFVKAFDASSSAPRAVGAEDAQTLRRGSVDDPGGERRLGTDDRQVDAALARERGKPLEVVGGDRDALGELGHAGRARRRVDRA